MVSGFRGPTLMTRASSVRNVTPPIAFCHSGVRCAPPARASTRAGTAMSDEGMLMASILPGPVPRGVGRTARDHPWD